MKLAPLSVPYRAFQKVSGILVVIFFVTTAGGQELQWAIAASAAVVLIAAGYEFAYYRRFEYLFTGDTFDIRSGVISRREREMPYRRIQNVDISRNVIQRALGLAAVDLETAGGSSTEGAIRYVTADQAKWIQREISRRKAEANGDEPRSERRSEAGDQIGDEAGDETAEFAGPEETDLYAISPRELALVGALSFDWRLIGLLLFLASGSIPVLSTAIPVESAALLTVTGIVAVTVLFFASWLLGATVAFSNYYGFRLSKTGEDLRYERGLFRRYSGSIPLEKVQTLTISDNPAKRLLGYATLTIETAGYAPGQGGSYGTQAAIPIAKTDRVYGLTREIESFDDPDFRQPPARIRWRYVIRYSLVVAAITAIAFGVEWVFELGLPWYGPLAVLLAVPAMAHYKWKHRGVWLGEDHLLTRNGFWSRQIKVVPYYRIQNVIDTRTVFQRRWDVATIVADTAGTNSLVGSDAAAIDYDTEYAVSLREELNDRLQGSITERQETQPKFEWIDETEDTRQTPDGTANAEGTAETEAADGSDPTDGPETGVVRPDFSPSERDFTEPAETVDTGNYAVDSKPSDTETPFNRPENDDSEDEDTESDSEDTESDSEGTETDSEDHRNDRE